MSIPLIMKQAGLPARYKGRIYDGAFDVLSSRTPLVERIRGAVRQAVGSVTKPVIREARILSGADLRKSMRGFRTIFDNDYALYMARKHGIDGKNNLNDFTKMVRDKARSLDPNQARKLDPLMDLINDTRSTDAVYGPTYEAIQKGFDRGRGVAGAVNGASGYPVPPRLHDAIKDINSKQKEAVRHGGKALAALAGAGALSVAGIPVVAYGKYKKDKNQSGDDSKSQPTMLGMNKAIREAALTAPREVKKSIYREHAGEMKRRMLGGRVISALVSAAVPFAFLPAPLAITTAPIAAATPFLTPVSPQEEKREKERLLIKYAPKEVYEKAGITRHSKHYSSLTPEARKKFGV